MTSERISEISVAGAAARASCPPLNSDRCLRTAFSSLIVAPAPSSSRVVSCFSASVIGRTGAGVSAEPPPETRKRTASSAPADRTRRTISSAAAWPRASGTGWPASRRTTRAVATV